MNSSATSRDGMQPFSPREKYQTQVGSRKTPRESLDALMDRALVQYAMMSDRLKHKLHHMSVSVARFGLTDSPFLRVGTSSPRSRMPADYAPCGPMSPVSPRREGLARYPPLGASPTGRQSHGQDVLTHLDVAARSQLAATLSTTMTGSLR